MSTQKPVAASPQRYAFGKVRTRQGDGDWDYFPYGWLGRGYRVDTTELARFIRLERGRAPMAILAIVWLLAWVAIRVVFRIRIEPHVVFLGAAFAAALIAMAWFAVVVARRTRRLAPAERPLTWMELRRWEASVLSVWRLSLLLAAAAGLAALGLLLMVRAVPDPEPDLLGAGLLSLAVGCYGFAKMTCTLWFRIKAGRRILAG